MTQIEEFAGLMAKAMPILQQVSECLPALQEFREWHNQEKNRQEAERLADEEHDQAIQQWLQSKQDEQKAKEEHEARIKPLLK